MSPKPAKIEVPGGISDADLLRIMQGTDTGIAKIAERILRERRAAEAQDQAVRNSPR